MTSLHASKMCCRAAATLKTREPIVIQYLAYAQVYLLQFFSLPASFFCAKTFLKSCCKSWKCVQSKWFLQDPLEPFVIYWKQYVISGLGIFTAGYVLFSISNIHVLFQQSYGPCWQR